jgi:hypothetical protein
VRGYLLGYLLFVGIVMFALAFTGVVYAGRWLLLGPLGLTLGQATGVAVGLLMFVCASGFAYLVGSEL